MELSKIDRNFDTSFTAPEDIEWFSVRSLPFKLYGIEYSEDEGRYIRIPQSFAKKVNTGIPALAPHTAGGRLRFVTDSPYVAIRAVEPRAIIMSHMTVAAQCGFTLYGGDRYIASFMPPSSRVMPSVDHEDFVFDVMKETRGAPNEMTLFFPLYNTVKELYIGLKRGCLLKEPSPYKHEKPVLFYGSSITQGGCATKPGDDYVNRLSMWLDTDILNLGFSGNAKGEPIMAEYLSNLDPSVYVIDYDHNAPNSEHLKNTHYPLYKAIREKHPETPIVFMTMPCSEWQFEMGEKKQRHKIIRETYDRALKEGDKNVYFISGAGVFEEGGNLEFGTVDGCHPDSLGFYRMAERVYPVLDKILNKR